MDRQPLRFRGDGTFTIAQFTDIHWIDGGEKDLKSRALMEQVVQEEKPDLVFFTGDVIYTGEVAAGRPACSQPIAAFRQAVSAAAENGIPWAFVFGNHDTERFVTREELMEEASSIVGCAAERGPRELSGVGNYVLEVEGSNGGASALLYGFDSGAYSPLSQVKGYDWIRRDQIDWYVRQSMARKQRNGGESLPAVAFFHIPLPEYRQVWEAGACIGSKYEDVCCPMLNTGLFAAMAESGDVMGTFCGHDHVNDYEGDFHGIRLCYGRASGYNTYGRDDFPRGARLIRLHEGCRGFDTWLRLDDGSVIQRGSSSVSQEM